MEEKHIEEVCLRGKGNKCCRYLGVGSTGWECLKHTGFKKMLDARAIAGQMVALGDNCEGFTGPREGAN